MAVDAASRASTDDGAARPATTTTTIGSASYLSATQYDANGRVAQLEYPSGLIVRQTYTAWGGAAASVTDAAGSTTYWQATNRMADGQIASMKVGPHTTTKTYDPLGRVASVATAGVQNASYVFDEVGNLTRRVDATVGQADETYTYDLLNRLTKANAITIASYDDAGNITSRSGTGSYNYYAGTHRLANLNGSGAYSYDANGNLTADGNRSVTSNAFNMPSRISGGGNTLDFAYDSSHARVQEVSSASGITNFVGSQFYEEQFRRDGSTYRRHYVATPEGVVALIVQRYRPQGNDTLTRYWHKDHLGSVAVITTDTALIVERFTFDVWGRRTQQFIATGEPLEERGYTGHETLDDVAVGGIGLVHMNGRIYDPVTGRFLSADPLVQSPYDGQSYNRYSYVLNNPLSFTDPTGFSWWTKWRRTIFAIAAAATLQWYISGAILAQYASFEITAELYSTAQAVGAIAGGFAAGGIQGGNIESALQGAFSAALFFGAGSIAEGLGDAGAWASGGSGKVGLHALAGCIGTAAAGGNCGKGAASAGFAEFAGPYLKTGNDAMNVVTSSISGAVGSRLAGGSFQSGAITGAFGYLFNECAHGVCTTKLEQALYDWWPGYKFGTGIYNSLTGGSFQLSEGIDGVFAVGGIAGKGVGLIGQTFGKLGTVIEESGLSITGFSGHALDQAISRGVAPAAMLDAVKNPLAVLQQGSGNYLHIGEQAAVVLNSAGRVVTTYPARLYDSTIQSIANAARALRTGP